ncbi:MAG: hypothetical protein LBH58_13730 [Tannerellaceae bacterium]|jgi:hypothetical protein|nr:hypothetical protein [Tannerellaceae bacterium]
MNRKIRHENKPKLKAGRYCLFLLFFIFPILNGVQAQMTIGSSNPPAEGVLLDLKQNEDSGGGTTSRKGVLFPRVALTGLDSLEPLVTNASSAEKSSHKGTVVYNMTVSPQNNLREEFYFWNGNKWMLCAEEETDVWKITGSAGTNPATNYLGTSDNQPLVLKANNHEGLRISTNGELYIANADELTNSKILVKDPQGKVGVAAAIPARVLLMLSTDKQEYAPNSPESTKFNLSGLDNSIAVTWKASDKKTNNIVEDDIFSSSGTIEEFTINLDGTYELSGFILYMPSSTYSINNTSSASALADILEKGRYTGVNAAIQLKHLNRAVWDNIVAARQVWVAGALEGTANTVLIPPTAVSLRKGDRIRMVFYHPSIGWGLPHGANGKWGITDIMGSNDMKKGLKIVAIN